MFDIWGFLLQTLNVSGVAILLLIVKSLLKDKLPPKWQFSVWSILGIMILFPVGIWGRYTLFNWRSVIEFIKVSMGNYNFTRIIFPFPVIKTAPHTITDWIFLIYVAGVVVSISAYLISYVKLRLILRKGDAPDIELTSRINTIGHKYGLKPCRIVVVKGLPSAFVSGVIRPILVVPETKPDEKVILHELFHLKNKDTFWSIVICLLRSLHWCNPLISYCTNLAINDMEARCDQFVLEQLEGEERRVYGKILLSMSNERFANTPGSTCINNGGKNIRKRIEAIARFKQYPIGMNLVSICVIIALGCALVVGVQASEIPNANHQNASVIATARSLSCSTYAGAFDTYAKAMLEQSGVYRLICAPENIQGEIITETLNAKGYPTWDCKLKSHPNQQGNYSIYNLENPEKNVYEGILVITLNSPPDDKEIEEKTTYLAYQKIRVEKENGRWVAIPLNEIQYAETTYEWLQYGCEMLPATTYTGTQKNFKIDIIYQTIYVVDNKVKNEDIFSSMLGNSYSYTTTPILNAKISMAYNHQESTLTHLGTQEERDTINRIGVSIASVYPGQEKPGELSPALGSNNTHSSSSDGTSSSTRNVQKGWGPTEYLSGGGSGGNFSKLLDNNNPEYYVADLYINNELYTQMELHLQEEE